MSDIKKHKLYANSFFTLLVILICVGSYFIYTSFLKHTNSDTVSTYSSANFSMSIPEGWKVTTSSLYDNFTIISPKYILPTRDVFQNAGPIITVLSFKKGTSTLEDFVNSVKTRFVPAQLVRSVSSYKLIEEKPASLQNGQTGYLLETSFALKLASMATTSSSIEIHRNLNLITSDSNNIYVVTATTPDNQWNKNKGVLEVDLQSFVAKNSAKDVLK